MFLVIRPLGDRTGVCPGSPLWCAACPSLSLSLSLSPSLPTRPCPFERKFESSIPEDRQSLLRGFYLRYGFRITLSKEDAVLSLYLLNLWTFPLI
ncbi:unnamed protein product, partial [Vitis vinifera]|uniref:Uncharacterized protein n=1 Tax=Vitis vinifera TaxID=29760 RepID=D7SPE5_VITVI